MEQPEPWPGRQPGPGYTRVPVSSAGWGRGSQCVPCPEQGPRADMGSHCSHPRFKAGRALAEGRRGC